MGSFRKELVADVQLLRGADAHECFDIRLLERTEHVVDFLHGSLLGRGEPTEPPSRESAVSSRRTASPCAVWTETTRSPGEKIVERCAVGDGLVAGAGASIVADSTFSRGSLNSTNSDRENRVRSWHTADYFNHLPECLLSGVKRTLFMHPNMSANDPYRTRHANQTRPRSLLRPATRWLAALADLPDDAYLAPDSVNPRMTSSRLKL